MNLVSKVFQANAFSKATKKLSIPKKKQLDQVVKKIISDPFLGEQKKGDLNHLQVYKFHMDNQLMLMGYTFDKKKNELTLISWGSHENFYRDLKNK